MLFFFDIGFGWDILDEFNRFFYFRILGSRVGIGFFFFSKFFGIFCKLILFLLEFCRLFGGVGFVKL